jgi:hypothetical protein
VARTGIGWVLRRTDRLLRPTTALFVVLPVVTVVTVAAGVDRKLLGHAAWLASIPLWFLLAYLVLVVLTPWLHALHRRAGLAVPAVMVVLVAVADLLRMGVGQGTLDLQGRGQVAVLLGQVDREDPRVRASSPC